MEFNRKISVGMLVIAAIMIFVTIIVPMWEDRPVVSVYLGSQQDFPIPLHTDASAFPEPQYANIFMTNIGKNQANIGMTITSVNATVSFDKASNYTINQTLHPFLIPPNPASYKIYVKPDPNSTSFSLRLMVTNSIPIYQEIDLPNEQKSTYHKNFDGTWIWSK